jgi:tetratricopeptide (TPR) repeat protein
MPPVPSWLRQCSTLSALGAVLRRRGKLEEAWEEFEKALEIHNKHLPQEVLHSEPGVRYCTLQLDRAKTEGEYEEVLRHANKMLDWSKKSGSPNATEIIEGLHWLTKSRALTELRRYDEALRTLNEAVRLVEHSNKIQFLCGALLARAAVQRLSDNLDGASADVIEVLRISGECNMKLYQADGHLLRGHIALDLIDAKRKAQASKDLEEARRLIGSENDGNCYRLRIAELHLLAARIEHYRNARKEVVQQCLNEAYRSFNNIGYWRLYRQWQCYKNGCWRR